MIRRLFSTSPRDPRYHMLSHLSSKFAAPTQQQSHEPRAALFLNRFTRTLTIMYATNGMADVLGMTGEEMKGMSFYHCIQENCLRDAVHCMENAKSNDSIAYLRFWFRHPRQDNRALEQSWQAAQDQLDRVHIPGNSSSEEDTNLYETNSARDQQHHDQSRSNPGLERRSQSSADSQAIYSDDNVEPMDTSGENLNAPTHDPTSRGSSGYSHPEHSHEAIFGEPTHHNSSASSASLSPNGHWPARPLELEAVVSCTSDGLVVCLRRAKEGPPLSTIQAPQRSYENGLFAVPWATNPTFPAVPDESSAILPHQQEQHIQSSVPVPHGTQPAYAQPWTAHADEPPTGSDFMNSIRDIAIFAWALVGINGSLAEYSSGSPRGESQPAAGIPIWQPSPDRERYAPSHSANNRGDPANDRHGNQLAPGGAPQVGQYAPAPSTDAQLALSNEQNIVQSINAQQSTHGATTGSTYEQSQPHPAPGGWSSH